MSQLLTVLQDSIFSCYFALFCLVPFLFVAFKANFVMHSREKLFHYLGDNYHLIIGNQCITMMKGWRFKPLSLCFETEKIGKAYAAVLCMRFRRNKRLFHNGFY